MPRRQFLKSAPAAGAFAYAGVERLGSDRAAGPTADQEPGLSRRARIVDGDYAIRAKPHHEVTLTDGFWRPRVLRNAEVTIPFEIRKRGDGLDGLRGGIVEAAMLSLQTHRDPTMQSRIEAWVAERAAEEPRQSNREFEIATTWFRTTGQPELVETATRSADLLYADFAANDPPFNGGERDSWNCAQLYRVTGDPKHLHLAKHYLEIRGREDSVGRSRHNQSYMPVAEQSEAVGHAVNCVTLMTTMAEVGVLGDAGDYVDAAGRMWHDAVSRKMYITGGVGSTGNEGFGEPYSLPNIDAYSETCAVLMFITLNHNLFLATGDSRYIDVMERGMYNNAIDGVSVSGDHYFYVNRLASAGSGRDLRWQRASLECCPPNLVRFMSRMPGHVYAQDRDGSVFVNLYVSGQATFDVGGRRLGLSVDSEMPWQGRSAITVSTDSPVEGTIRLRIPGWARNEVAPGGLYSYTNEFRTQAVVSLNGSRTSEPVDANGYVSIRRRWNEGDVIDVSLPMEVRTVVADPRVPENRGRFAVERGPIVYCCEWLETQDGRVLDLLFDGTRGMRTRFDAGLLGGAIVIDTEARSLTDPSSPYRPITLIPYHLWANRGAGEMSVWLSHREYQPGDTGPAGGLIFFVNPDYAEDGWRYLEAAPFDQSAGAQWGCFRREVDGARGTAVGTGRRNTADILAACDDPGTAAYLCANLVLNGVGGWFLPSTGELVLMYTKLAAHGLGDFGPPGVIDNYTYWASSQSSADMAAHVDFPDLGRVHGDDKDFPRRVRAIRAL
jgi:hypothetical protein